MKPASRTDRSGMQVHTYTFVEAQVKDQVGLAFLPSGTHFLSSIPAPTDLLGPRRLILATGDPQVASDTARSWLKDQDSSLEIIWNPTIDPDFSQNMSGVARLAPYAHFRTVNNTAHLLVSSNKNCASSLPPTPLTPEIATLLEEKAFQNVSIPFEVYKQVLWRYRYLLDQVSGLSNEINTLKKSLAQAKAAAPAPVVPQENTKQYDKLEKQNKTLAAEKKDLQVSLENIQSRYDALAKSRLGSLTLQYWNARKNRKKNIDGRNHH